MNNVLIPYDKLVELVETAIKFGQNNPEKPSNESDRYKIAQWMTNMCIIDLTVTEKNKPQEPLKTP